jgi:nuclear pore complex protein Nup54
MSLFGNAQPVQGGGLFGSNTNPQQSGGLFGQNTQNQQQAGSSLFGQPQQNQQQGGLFGQNTNTQQLGSSLFGNLNAQQNKPAGGLFGSTNTTQPSGGLFGQSAQTQQPAGSSLFGGLNTQQNQQQQQQQQQQGGSLFGGFGGQQNQQSQPRATGFGQPSNPQQQQNQFGNSQLWQPENTAQQKSVPDQMAFVLEKWSPNSASCVFKHYFYNKVDERQAPFYRPAQYEDPAAWEEALSKKPGPGYIPVLCTGFQQMGERIQVQQRNLAYFNKTLHDINGSLDAMLSRHDLTLSVRALDAKRKHTMLKKRSLALATKVQVLRNRGYAMDAKEDALKTKILALERATCDPGLSARAEEIWARMVGVRERARLLQEDVGNVPTANGDGINEEATRRAEKVCFLFWKDFTANFSRSSKIMANNYNI